MSFCFINLFVTIWCKDNKLIIYLPDTTAMMINIKSAFDNVSRDTLLETITKYRLSSVVLNWVYHFVSDRKANMLVDVVLGEERSVDTRVPQGSPVSPLLFLLYTAL
jgi:hypothetical protein